jgi:hypothetical protein
VACESGRGRAVTSPGTVSGKRLQRLGDPSHFAIPIRLWQGYRVSSIKQVAGRRPKRVYDQGRHCAHPGCNTLISRYNKNEYCWRHFQPRPEPARVPVPPPKA